MERRKLLKTAGVTAVGLTLTGCLGEEASGAGETNEGENEEDSGGDQVNPEEPGWFDIDVNIAEEQMGMEVEITEYTLFRTSNDSFGVRFTIKNVSNAPLTNVTVHARLLDENDEVIGEFATSLQEVESIEDLAKGAVWQGDVIFEGTDPQTFLNDVAGVELWATAEAESDA